MTQHDLFPDDYDINYIEEDQKDNVNGTGTGTGWYWYYFTTYAHSRN
jgi:hypothetical protein